MCVKARFFLNLFSLLCTELEGLQGSVINLAVASVNTEQLSVFFSIAVTACISDCCCKGLHNLLNMDSVQPENVAKLQQFLWSVSFSKQTEDNY